MVLITSLGTASMFGGVFELQGLSKGQTNWITGNVQNWQELDYIPCRVAISGKAFSGQSITIVFPHMTGTTPGFQNLYRFTASSNVTLRTMPVFATPANADWSATFLIDFAGGEGFVAFEARLAAGAHLNTGSSLMLRGIPSSMGNLQVHKPAPGAGLPDLAIVKRGPAASAAGDLITYSLAYTNQTMGTDVGRGVQISDILPPELAVTEAVGGEIQGNTIFWDLPNLSPGDSGILSFTARVSTNVIFGQTITNYAQILSSEDDLDYSDNSSTAVTALIINRPPVADNQALTTPEDTPKPITLTGSDLDGDSLTFAPLDPPAHGTLSGFNPATGDVLYHPATNYAGPDSFSFRVNDGQLDSTPATISITVTPVNDPPVADNQALTTPEDTPKPITLTGSDLDGDSLTFAPLDPPAHGTLSGFNPATGDVLYHPATNYAGPDSFSFRVNDGQLDSTPATISITVTPVNDPPVADNQALTTPEDTPKPITLTGSDLDGDSLTFAPLDPPAHGTLSGFNPATGDVLYHPATNYAGPDSFSFRVNDGQLDSTPATISITVTPVNDPPVADNQALTTPEDTPKPITLTGSDLDGDSLTFALLDPPAHGTLSGFNPATGAVLYHPATDYAGPDTFTFRVNDGQLDSTPATTSITVTPVNDPPITPREAWSYSVLEDGLLEVAAPGLLNGLSDPDGDTLSIVLVRGTTNGTLQINTNGAFVYQPAPDFFGPEAFQFQITDGTVVSGVLSAGIQVIPVNDPPAFVKGPSMFHQLNAPAQSVVGWAGTIRPGPANEAGQSVMFQVTSDNPSLFSQQPSISPDGTLRYAPAAGQFGVANISVVLKDNGGTANGGHDASEPQMFAITVNSPPLVSIVSPEDGAGFLIPANFTVAADGLDPDGRITRLDLYQSTNLLARFTNAGPYFEILTNVAPGTYEFSAYAEDDRGASAWSDVISVDVFNSPPVTAITPVTFNPQTGLFMQQVRVDNPSYYPLQGVKILVDGLPVGAALHNANGIIDGVPYILSRTPIPSGDSLTLTLEYYVPTSDFPTPRLSARLDAPLQTELQFTGIPQRVDRGIAMGDGTFLLEFPTEDGRAYVVEYSSDLTDWKSAAPVLLGDGAKRQWIDSGQPKTDSLPGTVPMRLYRVILLP